MEEKVELDLGSRSPGQTLVTKLALTHAATMHQISFKSDATKGSCFHLRT